MAAQHARRRRGHLGAECVVDQHDGGRRVTRLDERGQAGRDAVGAQAERVGIGAEVVVEKGGESRLVGGREGGEHDQRVAVRGLDVDRRRLQHEPGIARAADRRVGADHVAAHRRPIARCHCAHVAAPGGHGGDVSGARSQVQQDLGAVGGAVERQPSIQRRECEDAGLRLEGGARHGDHDRKGRARRGGLARVGQGEGRMQHRVAVQRFVEAQARQGR